MKKLLLSGLFCAFASTASAGSNCVDYTFYDNGGGYIVNNCSYTVFIRAYFNNGYVGGWGPLTPGAGKDTFPGRAATSVDWVYCNWTKKPGCSARR